MGEWWFNGILWDLPSGKRLHRELENHHAIDGKTHLYFINGHFQ